jgi:DNA helicase-2/ATP-dependent DNA helicase PcrA
MLLAGPGTGKTYLLVQTIKSQIGLGYGLSDFFEATLTNASAADFIEEARERISKEFSTSTTLHHRAKGVLHSHCKRIGLDAGFTVVDNFLEEAILGDTMYMLGCAIRQAKSQLKKYRASSAECSEPDGAFAQLYTSLQSFYSAIDWFEVVRLAVKVLSEFSEVRDEECKKFTFLLVDEYQDLNEADQRFVRLLLNGRNELVAAGDDDQSIYGEGLRYAQLQGIQKFQSSYPGAAVEILPVTSRLPKAIVDATDALIRRNSGRKDKAKLLSLEKTDLRAAGGFVASVDLKSEKAEREFLGAALQTLLTHDPPVPPERILVLCTSKPLGAELFESLRTRQYGLPLANHLSAVDDTISAEYKLALLRDFLSNHDRNLQLRILLKLILEPTISLAASLVQRALSASVPLWSAVCSWVDENRTEGTAVSLVGFKDAVLDAERLTDALDAAELVAGRVAPLSNLLPHIVSAREIRGEPEPNQEGAVEKTVRFMTLHGSKGLEADFVFIPFMEDSLELPANDNEERRRLLYVAMTRARIGVMFTWAWSRRSASRFKSQGTGGPPTGRKPSPYIAECGIPTRFPRGWDGTTADRPALELLLKHAKTAAQYDLAVPSK